MMEPTSDVRARVERLTGASAVSWKRIERGYAPTLRWVVQLAGGGSCFVKTSVTAHTRGALRAEARNLAAITAPFAPRMIGFDDGDDPVLVLEDLSRADWPPPWEQGMVARALETLGDVARAPVPGHAQSLERLRDEFSGWRDIADDSKEFLSLGFVSEAWLEHALPALRDAEARAVLDGNELCHNDVRSDNMCFDADRMVLVDWNHASRGNAKVDVAAWAPSLHAEGGPSPEEICPNEPELAALVAGYFASHAGAPTTDGPFMVRIRTVQRFQLWAARALGLPPPDGSGCLPGS